MDLLEIGLSVVDWVGLAQDRYRWRVLVNAVMAILDPQNAGKLSSGCTACGLSSGTQLHIFSYICLNWPFSLTTNILLKSWNVVENVSCRPVVVLSVKITVAFLELRNSQSIQITIKHLLPLIAEFLTASILYDIYKENKWARTMKLLTKRFYLPPSISVFTCSSTIVSYSLQNYVIE
jgi:hypothetical protein